MLRFYDNISLFWDDVLTGLSMKLCIPPPRIRIHLYIPFLNYGLKFGQLLRILILKFSVFE